MSRLNRLPAAFTAGVLLFASGVVPARPDAVAIVDAAGRTVRLNRLPQRVMAIGHGPQIIAHLVFMFPEGAERFIGWERRGKTASDFIPLIDPDYNRRLFPLPNAGVEEVAAMKPDLVLMRGALPDPKGEALVKLGIPVIYLGLEDPSQYRKDVECLGAVLGNPARAGEINRFYRERLGRVEKALAGIAESDKPSVLLAMTISRGAKIAVEVPAMPWMQTIQVRLAGGNPIWKEAASVTTGWTVVNLEQIARWDPDRVILVVWHSMDPVKTIDGLASDPRWRELRAVRSGGLLAFPSDLYGWDTPDPRWILGVLWLAKTFHPGRFDGFDMKTDVEAFYHDLYGMSEGEIEAKILPAIRMEYR
ncbi:MAG: ABC transporter substrate-binding protein [Candidatus Aminicenantes bacterium]|nr:ABC transporter substrate-binding protein [Candidatus Aminicenantes bacterium]